MSQPHLFYRVSPAIAELAHRLTIPRASNWDLPCVTCRASAAFCHHVNSVVIFGLAAVAASMVIGLATVRAVAQTPGTHESPARKNSEASAPARGAGRIWGRIVKGAPPTPAPGATVTLLLPTAKIQRSSLGNLALRRTTADANGEFLFDELAPGRYRVSANLGKFTTLLPGTHGEVVIIPDTGKPFQLRLVAGVAVTARLNDRATRNPIAGATVNLRWSEFPTHATTNGDGVALLQPLTSGQWEVEAWADGFAKEFKRLDLENGLDAEVEFLLGPGGSLEGIVRDPSGTPLAGVGLSATVAGDILHAAYTQTNKDGHYQLENLPRDVALEISVSEPEYARAEVLTKVTMVKEPLNVNLKPRPHGGSIAGTVVDRNNRPIAGAELVNRGERYALVRTTVTGPNGRFVLDNLYADTSFGKEVLVRAKGFAPKRIKVQTGPPNKPAELTIALEPGHRVSGRVNDSKGLPIKGVLVYFTNNKSAFSDHGWGETDAQGQFTFDSLPPSCFFGFSKSGFSEIKDREIALDSDQIATIAMVPAGVILGRVTDAKSGKPIRVFHIRVMFSPKPIVEEPSFERPKVIIDVGHTHQSNDGLFTLGQLVTGMSVEVAVSAEGYEPRIFERVVIAPPDNAQIAQFPLEPLNPANLRTFAGCVIDSLGKQVAGAQLRLIAARPRVPNGRWNFPFNWEMIRSGNLADDPGATRFLKAVTDERGRFRFTQIPRRSEIELAVWARGFAPRRVEQMELTPEGGSESITIALQAAARIVGTVDRKKFLGEISIVVSREDAQFGPDHLQFKAEQTDFELADLAPGGYEVSLMSPFNRRDDLGGGLKTEVLSTARITVSPGETATIHFEQ